MKKKVLQTIGIVMIAFCVFMIGYGVKAVTTKDVINDPLVELLEQSGHYGDVYYWHIACFPENNSWHINIEYDKPIFLGVEEFEFRCNGYQEAVDSVNKLYEMIGEK